MAAANYTTIADLKDELIITDTTQDTRLTRAVTDASRAVDAFCHVRQGTFAPQTFTYTFDIYPELSVRAPGSFGGAGTLRIPYPWLITDETRGYGEILRVPPLLSVTSLQTDENGDGIYEITWAAGINGDYLLKPYNSEVKREVLVNPDTGRFGFPPGRNRAQIVGSWGITEDGATPEAVRRATLIQAGRYYQHLAITGPLTAGTLSKQTLPVDQDVADILWLVAGEYRLQWLGV